MLPLAGYVVALFGIIHSFFRGSPVSPREIHGFVLTEQRSYPGLGITADLYIHQARRIPFLHLTSTDTHNAFSVTFPTIARDDTGSLHALEHLVLDSSKHFPVRSLFFEMIKRSPAVYLNAETELECTSYPFSTTSEVDFHHLLDVYLDVVFFPILSETSFQSECYRLEFETPNNVSTPLIHSGVVYNEMNGAFSEIPFYFSWLMIRNLLPNSSFRNYSGGVPSDLPSLTMNHLRRDHRDFYHPANALFLHYGSFAVEPILEKVSSVISQVSSERPQKVETIEEPRWDSPRSLVLDGPSIDNSSRSGVGWVVGDLRNLEETWDLSFLFSLLETSESSPLYLGLVKSGWCTRLANTGFQTMLLQPVIMIGCTGFNSSSFSDVVLDLLKNVYETGFNTSRIEAILHQQEMSDRTIWADAGLRLRGQTVGQWIHGVSPLNLLDRSLFVKRIRGLLKNQLRYFENLMRRSLINNPHRLDLTMKGNPSFQENANLKRFAKI
jgi:Zn-dependent M16 (insulinase) family peptidase